MYSGNCGRFDHCPLPRSGVANCVINLVEPFHVINMTEPAKMFISSSASVMRDEKLRILRMLRTLSAFKFPVTLSKYYVALHRAPH